MTSCLVRINSNDDTSATSTDSDFKIVLSNSAFSEKVTAFSVKSVMCFHTFYNIISSNNVLVVQVNSGALYSITLAEGWYDITLMMSTLQTAINAYLVALGLTTTVAITQNAINSKMTFTYTIGIAPADRVDIIVSATSTLAPYIGITSTLAPSIIPVVAASYAYTAANVCNLGGIQEIFVKVPEMNAFMLDPVLTQQSIICNIPVNAPYGGQIYYESTDHEANITRFNQPITLSKLSFQIVNRDGILVDFQNTTFRMVLRFYSE